jgi:hypothetical protein
LAAEAKIPQTRIKPRKNQDKSGEKFYDKSIIQLPRQVMN